MQLRHTHRTLWIQGLISFCLVLLTLSGCRSYHLGHPSELPFESIYIRPAANDSFAPQAQALISADVREAFIRDGRVKVLASEEDADVVLLINLTEYNRSPGARLTDDTVQAFDFDIKLKSKVSLYDQNKGRYYFQNEMIEADTNAYTQTPYRAAGSPNTQTYHLAESQAMPQVTREMARRIADRILSVW